MNLIHYKPCDYLFHKNNVFIKMQRIMERFLYVYKA
jgi:hypothetical protein